MEKTILYLAVLLPLLAMCGCNDDIFVDSSDIDPGNDQTTTIDGDKGVAEFTIPTKSLVDIHFDRTSDQARYYTYYNTAGDMVQPGIPASELGKIVYDDDMCGYTLIKKGTRLTFQSLANPLNDRIVTIRLIYTYTERTITINITRGQPLQQVRVESDGKIDVSDYPVVKTLCTVFTNGTSVDDIYECRPYRQCAATYLFEADYHRLLLGSVAITAPIPVVENGQWVMRDKEDIRPGTTYSYYREDNTNKTDIPVPAGATKTIITYVTCDMATSQGHIIFRNAGLDRDIAMAYTTTSYYPVSYKIDIKDEQ